ncbi:hypothetical protein GJ744_006876 [Endocarpon pusillum]|uniref:Uncharacterized protein n=1 Tax=Endocarpon pusillum TaxID=364733 RepID=A0A8H7A7P6_9EURO|nr:hypothetical protein GJ744_006876 [Endocarpon pusillum]
MRSYFLAQSKQIAVSYADNFVMRDTSLAAIFSCKISTKIVDYSHKVRRVEL